MRLYLIAALAVLALALSASAQTVVIKSSQYTDFRQLLSREVPAGTVDIAMTVRLPDEPRDRYPAIVIVHTIAGYQESNEGWHAEAFRKAGFATLTYTSAAVQRLREGDPGGWAASVAEAFAAFRLLADHPKVDARRIAVVGFSFGGEIAYLTALERLRSALVADGARFAAHVAYYPAGVFAATAESGAYTGAPILMLLGEKDDNLPLAKVQDYLAYSATIAPPLEVTIYPGAYHAWTVSTLGAPAFYPQYRSTRKCPYRMMGEATGTVLVGGKVVPERASSPDCLREGSGYTMGYDEGARSVALRDALAFLRKNLGP